MLERKTPPAFGKIESVKLQEPVVSYLDNGIPVHAINAGAQNVLKVELVFQAGSASVNKVLVGSSAATLITEGTANKTAAEIAEAVDFFGAYLQTHVTKEETSIELYTLNTHLAHTLKTLAEVYNDPIYPEYELNTFVLNGKQEMMVNQQKVNYLATKALHVALFGKDHPFGRSASLEDYDKLTRADLLDYYNQFFKGNLSHIIVAGKVLDNTTALLNTHFGTTENTVKPLVDTKLNASKKNVTLFVEKEGAVQNAISIGRVLFDRSHPDFIGMQMLCTVLGGYFGSRLMSNIREDKGYTYGISAVTIGYLHTGYLSISTEVGADVCDAALHEIYHEIEKLRTELIPEDELELVRNYMLGSILTSVDGAFALATKWKMYLKHGLTKADHEHLIKEIKTITADKLLSLANTYLQKEDLIEVVAGKAASQ
ncbi:M16 family metallopeptidase [Bacteroidota bacterium]